MDEDEFEQLNDGKASADRLARKQRREERLAKIKNNEPPPELDKLPLCPVVYADPPWRYDHSETSDLRAIENNYPTMTLDAIKALREQLPIADDAVLFLWATSPKLPEAAVRAAERLAQPSSCRRIRARVCARARLLSSDIAESNARP